MEETKEIGTEGISQDRGAGGEAGRKAARKQFSMLGGMYLIGTAVIFVTQIAVSLLIKALKPQWLENPNISLALSTMPMYLIGMPVLILLVKRIPACAPARHKMKAGQFVVAVIMCFAVMYLSNLAGTLITMIIGAVKGSVVQNEIFNIATSISLWLAFVFMVICAPIMEEYVFRKLIVDRTVRYGQGTAMVVSGLMFGLFHGNLNQFVYAFSLGVFLAYLYEKTGNLKITIGIHMIVNFMGGIVSTSVLEMIDLDEYMNVMASGGGFEAMYAYMMEHLAGWILYFLYLITVLGVMIAGFVLLIVCLVKKKFVVERGEVVLPKGKRFGTVILNVGMGAYCVVWIGMIIYQLLS